MFVSSQTVLSSARKSATMGQMLSSPVSCQIVERKGSKLFRSAVAEMQGWRVNHEDAHTMICDWGENGNLANFAVFDGHGGALAAKFVAANLFQEQAGLSSTSTAEAITDSFVRLDKRLNAHLKEGSGCTCVNVIVKRSESSGYHMKVANLGDSRAILARKNGGFEVTIDHKPDDEGETKRIVAAGGFVSQQDPARLDGVLSLSRAFGDFQFKGDPALGPQDQKMSVCPDVYEWQGEAGDCLILACDGVFDVMSNQDLAALVSNRVADGAEVGAIASEVITTCLERNSRDNMTCMVVVFGDGESANRDMELILGNFEQEQDDKVVTNYVNFAKEHGFNIEDASHTCNVCERRFAHMSVCPCKRVVYCSRECQKSDWKDHKKSCPAHTKSDAGGSAASKK